MNSSSIDTPFLLSPIDNLVPATYSTELLFFPVPKDHTDIAIQSFLHGLRSVFQAIPLLAGSIKAIAEGATRAGTLAITSPSRTVDEIVKIKDFRKSKKYSYSQLRGGGFPPQSLPPWDFFQLGFYADLNPPAMHVQITLIEDGLVLAISSHHTFIDATGTAVVLELWAASCRGETILNDQISSLWQPVALLEGHEKVTVGELPEYTYGKKKFFMNTRSPTDDDNQRGWLLRSRLASSMRKKFRNDLKPMLVKLFIFGLLNYKSLTDSTRMIYLSYADLARLKEDTQAADEKSDQKNWISTMDIISALLFCCVAQSRDGAKHRGFASSTDASATDASEVERRTLMAKLSRWLHHIVPTHCLSPSLARPQASSQFMTAVNLRKQCQLPPNYIRNVVLLCSIQSPLHELQPSTRNLATQAHKLRARIQELDSAHIGRVASMVRSVPDVRKLEFSTGDSQRKPITMSSWREQGICALDWGPHVGANCERVRIHKFFFDGLVLVLPEYSGSKVDGGIEMVLSLKKDAMRKLEKNEFFNQFAQWR